MCVCVCVYVCVCMFVSEEATSKLNFIDQTIYPSTYIHR